MSRSLAATYEAMKTRLLLLGILTALTAATALTARADVFYSGLQNIAIPTNFNGVYVNLQTGVVASPTFGGSPNWDINPFLGGNGVATSPRFQPARIGTGNEDRIVNIGFGTTIGAGLQNYSSGYGGSQGHIGTGGDQFQPNTLGYIGFQYSPDGTAYSGWMGAILNNNTAGGVLRDWAYETNGGSIAAGNIQQAAPISGTSVFTLTSNKAEAPRLGSLIANGTYNNSAYVSSVTKNGTGTWILGSGPASAAHSYTGSTTVNAGTLMVDNANTTTARLAGTNNITVNSTGTLLLGQSGGTASSDRINDAATVTLGGGTLNLGGMSEGAAGTTGIGALTLTATSTIDFGSVVGVNLIQFAGVGSLAAGSVLQIANWQGIAGSFAMGDQLLFAGSSAAFTSIYTDPNSVLFNGIAGYGVHDFGDYFEVFGMTPVPEPGTWAAGLLTLGALSYSQRRRFFRRRVAAASTTS